MAKSEKITQEELVKRLRTYAEAEREKREATNASNRAKTQARHGFTGFFETTKAPTNTAIVIDGVKYWWGVVEGEEIDPAKWFAMYEDGHITKEQFLDCISVLKSEAKKAIGEDQVLTITNRTRGDKADVRTDDYPDKPVGVHLLVPEQKRGILKRPTLQASANPFSSVSTAKRMQQARPVMVLRRPKG